MKNLASSLLFSTVLNTYMLSKVAKLESRRVRAYIEWLWAIKPQVRYTDRIYRKSKLKLLLQYYCNQSLEVNPWPYNN